MSIRSILIDTYYKQYSQEFFQSLIPSRMEKRLMVPFCRQWAVILPGLEAPMLTHSCHIFLARLDSLAVHLISLVRKMRPEMVIRQAALIVPFGPELWMIGIKE
jgi:hypothetical protein